LVQLRHRRLSDGALFQLAVELRGLTKRHGACLIVNDRIDIALAANADGVHLPEAGMDATAARRLLGDEALIGRSVHNLKELGAALHEEVDYVHFGPVFETPSKAAYGKPQGLKKLRLATEKSGDLPVYAVGGINAERVGEVIEAGALGIAAIAAVMSAADPMGAMATLVAALEKATV
jgi:thiamine-phosphate pyrophosphorylase